MSFDVRPEKQWLTAAEAASEALPGFVGSKSQVNRLFREKNIPARKRAGRGGGREFHWTSLPREARAEYLKRYGVTGAGDDDSKAKADSKELRAEARKRIVDEARAFIERRGCTIEEGLKSFAKAYKAKKLKLDPWVYGVEPEARPHQVRKWDRVIRSPKGVAGLIDGRGRKKGSGLLERDTLLHNWISARLAAMPHLSATAIARMVALEPPQGLGREVALRTLQRHLTSFKGSHKQALTILSNPDKGRSHYKPAFGTLSANISRMCQLIQIDASPADLMCKMSDGSFARMKLMAAIDMATRCTIVLVTPQPSARATMALVRRCILEWGWPETIKIDNGSEFSNFAFDRFCHDAPYPITLSYSTAYSPEQKGNIERFFGTLHRQFAEIAPGYIGHNVADRQAIENRKTFAQRFGRGEEANLLFETAFTPIQLQGRLDVWCREVYAQRPHEGLNGLRPFDVAMSLHGDVRICENPRLLDVLMLDAPDGHGIRVVGKRGIKLDNRIFGAPELGGILPNARRVHVRYDPSDPDRIVVYNEDRTEFLCIAVAADALTNDERMRIAQGMVAKHKKDARELRATTRAFNKQYSPEGSLDALLSAAANDAFPLSDTSRDGIIETMRPSPKAVAQAQAFEALEHHDDPPAPVEPTDEERAYYEERIAELNPPPRAPRMEQCDGYMRPAFIDDDFGFFDWALAHMAAGEALDAQDTAVFDALKQDELFQRLRKQKLQPLSQNAKEVS